ncbi:MAG: hypothetical protein ACFFCD_02385 [Promethearchaeota archaeon]
MIHNVYILKKTGESLIHGYYGSIEVDEALITGFLSAISSFAEEIGAESVESLVMKNMKFVYAMDTSIPGDPIIFAVSVDREDDEKIIKDILVKIKEKFIGRHKTDLEEWTGDIKIFNQFYDNLDSIIWEYVLNKYLKAFQQLITNKEQTIDEVITLIYHLFSPKIAQKLMDQILENLVQ